MRNISELRSRFIAVKFMPNSRCGASLFASLALPACFAVATPASGAAGAKDGRVVKVNAAALRAVTAAARGATVRVPLGGKTVAGKINMSRRENGGVRVAGSLANGGGSFSLATSGGKVRGLIENSTEHLAYRVAGSASAPTVREVPLSSVICIDYPSRGGTNSVSKSAAGVGTKAVPIFNSRPTAQAQIYIDFDGETVTDPFWNDGNPIVAPPFNLSDAEINQICTKVAEDFLPFEINITTDVSRYQNASVGSRMRVICTPFKSWFTDTFGSAGGVAKIDSFSLQGATDNGFTPNIPCWVFNSGIEGMSETISHEVGHTLALLHDGQQFAGEPKTEYFQGHGTGNTSWAPIMGDGFNLLPQVTQWSKGEYVAATNLEDDIAIISGIRNGFGYATDTAGPTIETAAPLGVNPSTGDFEQAGVIERADDVDIFSFTATAGPLTIRATPAVLEHNLDISLELLDSTGTPIDTDSPQGKLDASVSGTLTAGTYYVKVQNDGNGDPKTDGYSRYASLGAYFLTSAAPAPNASLVVNTLDDHNDGSCSVIDCTLREAIAAANAAPDADTITFANGLTGTIQLVGGATSGALPQLATDISINGPGAQVLTVRGEGIFDLFSEGNRIFSILEGSTVSISGLTMTNGFRKTNDGGGIYNDGALTLTDCVITGNRTFARGGGVVSNGPIVLERCVVSDNVAGTDIGGIGISNTSGAVSIIDCTISGNTAGGNGGGILTSTPQGLTLTRCSITGNSAGAAAGGLVVVGPLTVVDCLISGNGAGSYGGAVASSSVARVSITNSTLTDNEAGISGGALTDGSGTQDFVVRNCTIVGNRCGDAKGAAAFPSSISRRS